MLSNEGADIVMGDQARPTLLKQDRSARPMVAKDSGRAPRNHHLHRATPGDFSFPQKFVGVITDGCTTSLEKLNCLSKKGRWCMKAVRKYIVFRKHWRRHKMRLRLGWGPRDELKQYKFSFLHLYLFAFTSLISTDQSSEIAGTLILESKEGGMQDVLGLG